MKKLSDTQRLENFTISSPNFEFVSILQKKVPPVLKVKTIGISAIQTQTASKIVTWIRTLIPSGKVPMSSISYLNRMETINVTVTEFVEKYYLHDSSIEKIDYDADKKILSLTIEFCFWWQPWYNKNEPRTV